jgi:hypothetical protein
MARKLKIRKRHSPEVPKTDKQFQAKEKAFDVVAAARRNSGKSLGAIARETGTTVKTVRKYLPAALRKSRSGKWVVSKSDRYVRHVSLPGQYGHETVKAHGSKQAQLASAYWAAIGRWTASRNPAELAPFHGKKVGSFEFITDPRTLNALRDSGLLQLDSLYAGAKGVR